MRQHPWVVIAGAFTHMKEGALTDADGQLNAIGRAWAAA